MQWVRRTAALHLSLSVIVSLAFGQSSTLAQPAAPQTSHSTVKPAAPWKRYCHPSVGFCFRYPSSWMMLGEVFGGKGVVVAPEQKGDRALWDAITVAVIAPPAGDGGQTNARTLDGVIEQATSAMREAGQNLQTLQRQQQTVDGNPAQMLKTRYRENSTGRDWIEELVFIQGPENEIYSVALKCAPEHLVRLEPVLKGLLGSWRLPQPAEPATDPATPAK